jgi:hypothetical protein
MRPTLLPALFGLAACLTFAANANAATIYSFGNGSDSLHGATGSLTFETVDADTTRVIWSMDTTGFDDAAASGTKDRTELTHIAFKISGITAVMLEDPTLGTLAFPSNVNSGGCDSSSPASMVCLGLANPIDATVDQLISVSFLVDGKLDYSGGISYRGKFGPDTGWVISESVPAVPEPSAALVFAVGLLTAAAARRARRR